MRLKGFIGPSYTLSSVNVDCQRCVNMYPQVDELGTGKEGEVASLVSTPGLTLLCTLTNSPVRGTYTAANGTLFAVGGNTLYNVTANSSTSSGYVAMELGTLNTGSGYVSMADNGQELVVVDGTNGYALALSNNAFQQITDPNFLGATQVAYQDGYFIFNLPNSQEWYVSNLFSTSFNPLSIGDKEGSPDYIVGQISVQENVYVFGSISTEVFYNAGTAPFPFVRIDGAVLNVGCSAAFTIAQMNGCIFWVGGDKTGVGQVFKMTGYQRQRVSTSPIEQVIRSVGATNLLNARAWVYQQGGHLFYCLNIPTINSTWVYDDSCAQWHELAYLGINGLQRHLADSSAVAYGMNIVGDYQSGNIYFLDQSNYTDNGNYIPRIRTATHLSSGLNRLFHNSFELDMETGVGLDGTQQGTNPQVILEWSNDGGHTWSNQHFANIGKIGQTRDRVLWRRLGAARDRVYRVTIIDPVKVTLIGAELEISEGYS